MALGNAEQWYKKQSTPSDAPQARDCSHQIESVQSLTVVQGNVRTNASSFWMSRIFPEKESEIQF